MERRVSRPRIYDDKDLLTRMYVDEGMTIAEIARELLATSVTIQKYLKKHEIPPRGRGPRKGRRRTAPPPRRTTLSDDVRGRMLDLVRSAITDAEPGRSARLRELEQLISAS